MAATEIDRFAKDLLKSQLLQRETIQNAYKEFSKTNSSKSSSETFAHYLIEQELLTAYQAKRVLAGRTEGFFLGGCRILDRLGKGGMGVVYLAHQERLDRKVALKVLPFQGNSESPIIKRFYREARAAARLKHPHIVQVFNIDRAGKTHFIVMEFVNGQNLYEILKQDGPFPVGRSLLLIKQAAHGLLHAHENGIVHRDIKPSNLMLEGDQLKILDLGLASLDSDEQLTADSDIMGTLDYMSPEQFASANHVDHRSDIYSLGCTWFHLLTGRAPFGDRLPAGKMSGHVSESVPSPSENNANIPDSVSDLILQMTAKTPESRYQSMSDLITDLNKVESVWQEQTVVGIEPDVLSMIGPSDCDTRENSGDQNTADSGDSNLELSDQGSDYETVVHAPEERIWGVSLTYFIPVMMTLVLGGVYVGIQLIKDKIKTTETIVIDLPKQQPAQSVSSKHGNEDEIAAAQMAGNQATVPPRTEVPMANPQAESPSTVPEESVIPTISPQVPVDEPASPNLQLSRAPRETVIRQFEADWHNDIVDGDVLTLVSKEPYQLKAPFEQHHRLTIQGTEASHAIVVLSMPAQKTGWTVHQTRLELKHVDLYVDLQQSTLPAVEVFALQQASLSLFDSTVTLLPSSATDWENTDLITLEGANEWDPSAKGDAPPPLSIQLDRAFIRGNMTLLQNRSTQSELTVKDCLIATAGPLVHAYHQNEREFAHQMMAIQVISSTIDSDQALLRVDCRPFELRPVPMILTVKESIITTLGAVTSQSPLIFWSSPVDRFSIPDSITLAGQSNVYLRRRFGLTAMSMNGEVITLVQTPEDWSRQTLGEDAGSTFADFHPMPRWPHWHERLPRAYDNRLLLRPVRGLADDDIGVRGATLTTPRRL